MELATGFLVSLGGTGLIEGSGATVEVVASTSGCWDDPDSVGCSMGAKGDSLGELVGSSEGGDSASIGWGSIIVEPGEVNVGGLECGSEIG